MDKAIEFCCYKCRHITKLKDGIIRCEICDLKPKPGEKFTTYILSDEHFDDMETQESSMVDESDMTP